MNIKYLDRIKFNTIAKNNKCKNWDTKFLDGRWKYHNDAINLIKKIDPNSILEAGTLGMILTDKSDTIEFDGKKAMDVWPMFFTPTFNHDLIKVPWPIGDKKYDLFVALRVFQHLTPFQSICFSEAKRISNNIILGLPKTITLKVALTWSENIQPIEIVESGFGTSLYYWKFN